MPITMKNPRARFYILLAVIAFSFTACQKSDLVAEEEVPADIEQLKTFIANSMDIPEAKVAYGEVSKEFTIDGDGKMSLQQARDHYKNSLTETGEMGASGMAQRKSYYSVSASKAPALKIYVDGTVPSVWQTSINAAIANWNAAGSNIYITRIYSPTTTTTSGGGGKGKKGGQTTTTTTTNYDMIVTTNNEASNTIATAYYPNTDGTPGKTITINTYHNGLAESYKVFAITHEIGHSVGFTHTNGTYGSIVTGTPELDPSSVMNSVCLPWSAFTSYDLLAFRTVYPK